MESLDIAYRAREALMSKKGTDILIVDVRGTSPVTDYFVLATGATAPQLKAMTGSVVAELKQDGMTCFRRSGVPDDGWMVLDYFDVVIHVFQTEVRAYYAIEELWAAAPRVG